MEEKQKNIINLTHSIVASFFSYKYIQAPSELLSNIIFTISFTYFVLDTWYIRNKDYLDLVHHILSCLVMISFYFEYYQNILIELFYLAEMSNIAIFGHYHIMKSFDNKNIIFISSILEFMIYSYFRVICMTQIIIDNLTVITSSPLSILLIIYYMSIDWSYTLFNKLLEEAKNI